MTDADRLHRRCLAGQARLGATDTARSDRATARLEGELAALGEAGFVPVMLAAADVADFARRQGIGVGPGRGAVAGSLVAYLAGITDVDPLRHGLLFERFLHAARRPRATIAIDIEPEGLERVQRHVEARASRAWRRIRVLPSDDVGLLFDTARRAWPERPPDETLRGLPVADGGVLGWMGKHAPDGIPMLAGRIARKARGLGFTVRSFTDLTTLLRFVHFPTDAGLLRPFVLRQRGGSTGSRWPGTIAEIVSDTRGMLLFQEQAMRIMNTMAGVALVDACEMLGAARRPDRVASARHRFLVGAARQGCSDADAERLWRRIEQGTARACQAHFTGLAELAYRTAYLRVRCREPFEDALASRTGAPGGRRD